MKTNPSKLPVSFPKRFFWGAATSAHQVEGDNHNQWSVWELENARALAKAAEYRIGHLAIWDEIEADATDPKNYISGKAADHYNRYEEDFDLLKKMNMNAYRFSIEWSRIEPEEGKWDMAEIEHYRKYLKALKARNIEPFVTLLHWTMPVWFADKGGFEKRRNVAYFLRFTEKIFEELGNDFRYVMTFNEPEVYIDFSYREGLWPPQKHSRELAVWVYLNLAYAHRKVYKLAKRSGRKFQVSIVKNCSHHYPGDDATLSQLTAWFWRYIHDFFFLDLVRRQLDWLGVNFYFSNRYYGYRLHNPDAKLNDLGWDMRPDDMQPVIEHMFAKYKVPIIITESGVADRHDKYRKWWIMHNLLAMHKAMQNGAQVDGYLHWSLLDNFEWAHGKWPRFGLVAVDYKTFKRTPRESAGWFAKVIKQLRGL